MAGESLGFLVAENNTKSSVKRENRVEERRKEKSEFSAQKFTSCSFGVVAISFSLTVGSC